MRQLSKCGTGTSDIKGSSVWQYESPGGPSQLLEGLRSESGFGGSFACVSLGEATGDRRIRGPVLSRLNV